MINHIHHYKIGDTTDKKLRSGGILMYSNFSLLQLITESYRESTWWLWDLWTFREALETGGPLAAGLGKGRPDAEAPPRRSFLRWTIIECNCSMPSSRPSPVTAQVGCKYHWAPAPSSLRPNKDSSLLSSIAEGKSCLLANTKMGTCPAFVELLQIFNSSSLASSRRSSLVESTTKMMPSVHRV
jgi:hypothetical protein